MPKAPRIECLGRRQFVVGASVAAALLPVLLQARDAFGQDAAPAPNPASPTARTRYDEIYAQLTKGAKPTEGKLAFEVPEIAENGNTVPFVITADSPMTADSHIKAIHLLSTENPQAGVATFRFTPESGKATVASRMRLAKSQDIVALAELSDGKLWVARTKVTVTIGGCGG